MIVPSSFYIPDFAYLRALSSLSGDDQTVGKTLGLGAEAIEVHAGANRRGIPSNGVPPGGTHSGIYRGNPTTGDIVNG